MELKHHHWSTDSVSADWCAMFSLHPVAGRSCPSQRENTDHAM